MRSPGATLKVGIWSPFGRCCADFDIEEAEHIYPRSPRTRKAHSVTKYSVQLATYPASRLHDGGVKAAQLRSFYEIYEPHKVRPRFDAKQFVVFSFDIIFQLLSSNSSGRIG